MELARLEIYMLGNLRILLNGRPIIDKMSNKAIGILCYLAFHKGKPISRDKLASFFWDSGNIEAVRYNMRYNLWALRKTLMDGHDGHELIITQKDRCKLNMDGPDIYVDVFEMEDMLKAINQREEFNSLKQLERIKSIYRGDFLEGFYIKNCPEWNDWIFYERQRFQRKYFEVLCQLTSIYKNQGNYFKCIEVLEEMLRHNPLQEELYVELIKVYLELGDRKSALNQYKRCCSVLREELNVGPMDSTKKIYEEIVKCDKHHESYLQEKTQEHSYSNKVKIFYSQDKNVQGDIIQKRDRGNTLVFNTECYPIKVSYYWISSLIEEIVTSVSDEILEEIPQHYWMDLARLNLSVLDTLGLTAVGYEHLSPEVEKNRIFKAMVQVLNHLSSKLIIWIGIKNFHCIDETSIEFLKFALFNDKNSRLSLILTGQREDFRFHEMEKYFLIEMLDK